MKRVDIALKKLMEVGFKETEDGHFYNINGVSTYYPGVTTILKVLGKPALVPWASKMAAEAFAKEINALGRFPTLDELAKMVDFSKKAPTRERDKAGDIGTTVHDMVDMIVCDKPLPKIEDDRVAASVEQFYAWADKTDFRFVMGDTPIASRYMGYGGRLDALAVDPQDNFWLIDFKTSKSVWPEMSVQCGAYAMALEETYDVVVHDTLILHIRPESCEEYINPNFEASKDCFKAIKTIHNLMPLLKGGNK